MFNVTTELMPHQEAALNKMLPSIVGGLFMDMGTGKSLTAIKLAYERMQKGKIDKIIWCCPVSLKQNTLDQILRHTDCDTDDVYIFNAKTTDKNIPQCTWYIVGVESIGQSSRVTVALNALVDSATMLIVDESTFIKGHRSKRTSRLISIGKHARYRLILTGTPITQGIEDLYAQFTFLSEKILGYASWYSFQRAHIEWSERYKGKIDNRKNSDYLSMRIAPYVYQVTKQECLVLPDKSSSSHYVALTDEQDEYYQLCKQKFEEAILEYEEDSISIEIYRLFTRLQSVANGIVPTGFINHGCEIKNRKIDELIRIYSHVQSKHVVIWCKYINSVKSIKSAITEHFKDEPCYIYYGNLNEAKRQQQLESWRKNGGALIATQSCGGYGLTLTEADYSIFYSNGFKYSERVQAEDRLHRIGQVNQVHYASVWADCGIEDRVRAALYKKADALECFREEVNNIREEGSDAIKVFLKNLL